MKTIITTLNSKFIHKALSLRLLYVACKDFHDVDYVEFTIKDDISSIFDQLVKLEPDNLVFSVYIWNVTKTMELIAAIKREFPAINIIVGGPEVSYDVDHFLDNHPIDYLIAGEGEMALRHLLDALAKNQEVAIGGVSTPDNRDYHQTRLVDLAWLETLDSPYVLDQDLKDMKNRILYFETSRGCPYQCQYCLSSLEVGLRFFSLDYLKNQLDAIVASGVKTIKFLDRSFNAKYEHARALLEYIVTKKHAGVVFQFEINGDVLDQRLLDFLINEVPPNLIRLEIGIQSTFEPTNLVVKRYQNFQRLEEVIASLQQAHNIVLHLDLIAGLPLEKLGRFQKSFDDVFALKPKELQLGFLKLLRGTSLRKNHEEYGYEFDVNPPYEITRSNDLSAEDITKIHLVEDMLEKYWNSGRFEKTMNRIYELYPSMFAFFLRLGEYYQENRFKPRGYQLDELYGYLADFLKVENQDLFKEMVLDYFHNAKVKPKRFYEPTLTTNEAKQVLHHLVDQGYDQELLFRYSLVEKIGNDYIVGIFKDYRVQLICGNWRDIDAKADIET